MAHEEINLPKLSALAAEADRLYDQQQEARAELHTEAARANSHAEGLKLRLEDQELANEAIAKERDQLRARLARLEEAAADTIALECSGLSMDGVDGSTCMTQDGWKDHPGKWCHVCTMARALESETK